MNRDGRKPLVVAVAQPVVRSDDLGATMQTHAEAVRRSQAQLVVFPELSLTGYRLEAPALTTGDPRWAPLLQACRLTGAVALVGAPVQESQGRAIATLRVDGAGVAIVYRKCHLGGGEVGAFVPGPGPALFELHGWRIGLAICKDTGSEAHTQAMAALGVDLYAAGVVHAPDELEEQNRRGQRICAVARCFVAFASFAGATGGGYETTAGESTIWAPDGRELARAGNQPGEVVRSVLI